VWPSYVFATILLVSDASERRLANQTRLRRVHCVSFVLGTKQGNRQSWQTSPGLRCTSRDNMVESSCVCYGHSFLATTFPGSPRTVPLFVGLKLLQSVFFFVTNTYIMIHPQDLEALFLTPIRPLGHDITSSQRPFLSSHSIN
jgi:hypothetical protein